jgi:hypothetical protein
MGSPPRNAVPFLALALVLAVVGTFAVHGGVAGILFAVVAVGALAAAAWRWRQEIARRGDDSEFGDDPESYRRQFGDSIVDARTQVDPQIGMRPIDTSRDR